MFDSAEQLQGRFHGTFAKTQIAEFRLSDGIRASCRCFRVIVDESTPSIPMVRSDALVSMLKIVCFVREVWLKLLDREKSIIFIDEATTYVKSWLKLT